jgi:hypothetical protein
LETDPNRLEAEAIARELAEMDASLPSAGDSHVDAILPVAGEPGVDASPAMAAEPRWTANPPAAGEPEFSGFAAAGPLLPRWLYVALFSLLGAGAVILAGMFVTEERKTDKALELVAANSRGAVDVPVVQAAAPLPAKKPTDMVFLKEAAPSKAVRTGKQSDAAVDSIAPVAQPVAASPKEPETDARTAAAPVAKAAPAKAKPAAKATATAKASPAKAKPVAKAGAAKAKPAAKKAKPQSQKATALAPRGETRTWPRERGDSITERMNAAVAACRARPHAPGECNLRACDILGSSDPACR